jgi:two-component system sensor histidine kinase QseC
MTLKSISLQTRLTFLVTGTVLLFGLLAGYESYKNALNEADEIFDAQLAQFAQSLGVLATTFDDEQADTMPPPIHKYQQAFVFEVWITDKEKPRILLRSNNFPSMLSAQSSVEGFSSAEWQGQRWRYLRIHDARYGFDVLVGQNDNARNELAQEVAWHNLAPFRIGLPLLAFFAMLAIYYGLRPLRRLTESLHQLSPDQLNPLSVHDAPKEIAPVVDALNNLLGRIAKTIENERRFTADASHELRTPLAALQAQVQAAQLSSNAEERNESLAKVMQGAERMAHLVGQLLVMSRLDDASSPGHFEPVNLIELTQECCAELGVNALARHIEIGFSFDQQPQLSGSADMLRILLRNLLDNAIRYTPEGGRVEVSLGIGDGQQLELEIADSGIGVDDVHLALLGQRFSRITPSVADGVGLGLSIAQRIAEIHHARISFSHSSALGGLSAKVIFPAMTGN